VTAVLVVVATGPAVSRRCPAVSAARVAVVEMSRRPSRFRLRGAAAVVVGQVATDPGSAAATGPPRCPVRSVATGLMAAGTGLMAAGTGRVAVGTGRGSAAIDRAAG
jgi:hypothetical protein